MELYTLIGSQIQALYQELNQAERQLNHPQIDESLRRRLRARFDVLFNQQRQALNNVKHDVDSHLPLDICWQGLRTVRSNCQPIFQESLALIKGALFRSAGLDDGMCQIADVMLDDLSEQADLEWNRFTILAEGEFFADMAAVIRLRFQDTSIWSLPVAAHEFGHFVGAQFQSRAGHPLRVLLAERLNIRDADLSQPQYQNTSAYRYLHEHLADLYATHVLGPSFVCACILLRFDPATQDSSTHPSSTRRVHLMLEVLRKMNAASGRFNQPYTHIIDELRTTWEQSLQAVGQPEALPAETAAELNIMLDDLYIRVFNPMMPSHTKYQTWTRALTLANQLAPDNQAQPILQNDDTIPDILNAAWFCRLSYTSQESYAVNKIGERARDLCHAVALRSS